MSDNASYGTYRALVANTDDPEAAARVTVIIPQVLGNAESHWAIPSAPTNVLPNPGDLVWVTFDGGDLGAPVYQPYGLRELDAKIDGIVATGGGDTTNVPKQPTGLATTTGSVIGDDGTVTADVTVTWDPTLSNQDGTDLTNLGGYYLQYSYDGTNWSGGATTQDTRFVFTGLSIGVLLYVRVAAFTKSATPSLWSSASITTATSTLKPPQPSAPDAHGVLGGISVTWDGNSASGPTMTAYVLLIRIERDVTSDFTNAVVVGSLRSPGTFYDTGTGYVQNYYYRLVAVSRTNVSSDPSLAAQAKGKQADENDYKDNSINTVAIVPNAITEALIHKGAVTSDKIADGAVTDLAISDFALTVRKMKSLSHQLY